MALPETARRIRAAMAYGGYAGRDALAEAIDMSSSTLQRIEGVAEPVREPKRAELLAIAEACDVPMWFLEGGWEGWRRLQHLEEQAIREKGQEAKAQVDRAQPRRRAG